MFLDSWSSIPRPRYIFINSMDVAATFIPSSTYDFDVLDSGRLFVREVDDDDDDDDADIDSVRLFVIDDNGTRGSD